MKKFGARLFRFSENQSFTFLFAVFLLVHFFGLFVLRLSEVFLDMVEYGFYERAGAVALSLILATLMLVLQIMFLRTFFSIFTDYKFPILEWAYCWLRRVVMGEKEDG